jgi:hypothetical protein
MSRRTTLECQYITGDPQEAHAYCGAATDGALPYCGTHAALVYDRTRSAAKRDRWLMKQAEWAAKRQRQPDAHEKSGMLSRRGNDRNPSNDTPERVIALAGYGTLQLPQRSATPFSDDE